MDWNLRGLFRLKVWGKTTDRRHDEINRPRPGRGLYAPPITRPRIRVAAAALALLTSADANAGEPSRAALGAAAAGSGRYSAPPSTPALSTSGDIASWRQRN